MPQMGEIITGKEGECNMGSIEKMISVEAEGITKQFPSGTDYGQIAEAFRDRIPYRPLLVEKDGNEYREMAKHAREDCRLRFITLADKAGRDTYKRSLCLMMLRAFYTVTGKEDIHIWIRFTVSGGLFCTMESEKTPLTQELLDKVKEEMESLSRRALPFEKRTVNTTDATQMFYNHRMYDKAKLFNYRIQSKTNVYSLNGFDDYYYGYMCRDSSCVSLFDLKLYKDGFVLMLPDSEDPLHLPQFRPVDKLFEVQNRSRRWGELLKIDSVGDLNDLIAAGGTKELILTQEAMQERQISEIAADIAKRKDVRLVLIAGPSSSSKTTFSHRLSTQLSVHGLIPHPIPMDDYFKNREDTPVDEDGNYNFECLEAIDVELFNSNMNSLLAGEDTELPSFNFRTGKREYKGKHLKLEEHDILVIEGIHGLNDKLSYALPKESKYRIYISALTQLNIDEHNRIPTTDGRLLRRIVRDQRTRGTSARNTIAMWHSVRRGEEQYIFPFQESADVMFNSALIYELAVLKTYAQPMLFAVERDSPEWAEAKKLLKFLDYFLPIPADDIPKNSLVREFIGGSIFDV